jgi:23S rRNA (pseudouridine1915-N3)-methyltransferase
LRIVIASVGQAKGAFGPIEDEYVTMALKLGRSVGLRGIERPEIAQSRARTAGLRMDEEAGRLSQAVHGSEMWALDPAGKPITTEEFADLFRRALQGGAGSLAFLIGGPDGLSSSAKQGAAGLISFGRLTWPHRLVRVMLAEQIYRVVTILVNHPYHRGG